MMADTTSGIGGGRVLGSAAGEHVGLDHDLGPRLHEPLHAAERSQGGRTLRRANRRG